MKATNRNQKWNWATLAVAAACLAGAPAARADLLLTVQSVTAAPGDVGDSFDVFATNTGTAALDVSGFTLEVDTPSTDITLEYATIGTTLYPYIFAGNSLFGPVISYSGVGQSLDSADLDATPGAFTVVNPGESLGIAQVFFNVSAGAPDEIVDVTINTSPALTSASTQSGSNIPLDFSNGEITVQSTVPEPGTLAAGMLSIGLLCLFKKTKSL